METMLHCLLGAMMDVQVKVDVLCVAVSVPVLHLVYFWLCLSPLRSSSLFSFLLVRGRYSFVVVGYVPIPHGCSVHVCDSGMVSDQFLGGIQWVCA